MSWHYLMLAQNLVAAGLALYTRKLSRRYPGAHFQVLAVILTVMYVFGVSFVIASGGSVHWATVQANALLFCLTGLAFLLSYSLVHRVFEHVDTAVGSLYSTLHIIGVVIAASLILHERLTWQQLVGAALLLAAMSVMLSAHTTHKRHQQWLRALLLAAISSIFFGFAVTGEKYLLDKTNLHTYLIFGWGAQYFWTILFSLIFNRHKFKLVHKPAFMHDTMIASVLRTGSGFMFMLALVLVDNSSLVAVWSGLRVFLAAALAAIFLRERQFLTRKIEASVIAIIAIAILLGHSFFILD